MCGKSESLKIGNTDFWDLQNCSIVKCNHCNNIQLDPMLTQQSTTVGCYAYHLNEMSRVSITSQKRNLIRNFRRGVLFASQLKKSGHQPKEILEYGPGSGYFLSGIQFIFPEAKITVVDIVEDVLNKNKEVHGYEGIKGVPEEVNSIGQGKKFDLIIARDILEHVGDVSKMIKNIHSLLNDNGLFHFITPNGHEDVWGHYLQWKFRKKPSELLINHVNYFDGAGLQNLLMSNGLQPIKYYTYQLKWTFRGKGWSNKQERFQNESQKISAQNEVNQKENLVDEVKFDKHEILNVWYIKPKLKWLTVFVSWYHHCETLKLAPQHNVGHEIYGVFIKAK
jgi:2-polyprenyl-3-methyl-5-hydroxy-6-metoxy-1,4-benzoquinol methylase